jgi:D-beta-D-heptose 7-phosphate kinase/D-beta-D-heptose 1-phosphate adenosyltransferase
MRRLDFSRLESLLAGFARVRLAVVGDVLLDEYVHGDVERVSPEAPVPVVLVRREQQELGGAANVARNVAALGGQVELFGFVGDDDAGAALRARAASLGCDAAGLVVVPARPTTRKTRIVARNQQLLRFDRETDDAPPPAAAAALLEALDKALVRCHGVIAEDYAKGALDAAVAAALMQRCRAAGRPVALDPKSTLAPYRGAELIKPNLRETELLSGRRARTPAELARAVSALRAQVGPAHVVVTAGARGMTLFEGDAEPREVGTVAREVFDVQGAGDTSIAALTLALRAGASLLEAAVIANAAAGVVVGKLGTATASPREVEALLPAAIAAAEVLA